MNLKMSLNKYNEEFVYKLRVISTRVNSAILGAWTSIEVFPYVIKWYTWDFVEIIINEMKNGK